jgi:RHS repeat-associated protein
MRLAFTTLKTSATPRSKSLWDDKLNRVTSSSMVTGCGSPQFTYSEDGNLTSKGGTTGNIGTITYGTTARTNGAGPHAVASANGKTYAYDENGNFIYYKPYTDANGNRTSYVDYLPFNLPRSITGNNTNISGLSTVSLLVYDYDADHTRITEQVYSGPNAGSNTIYVGPGFFEVASNANGTKEYRHYIGGPDGTIGIRTVAVDASNNVLTSANGQGQTTRYWFKDHLGSPASEYDVGAVNLTPLGFDTWGLRRKNTSANNFTQSLSTADLASYQSPRGYTGHEHLDDVGLIHMNGRIYDPMIGRFMQPDPIISEPYNSQNFNRYAYVLNNPLMYTDPSGYSTWTEIRRPVAAIVVAVVAQWAAGELIAAYADAFGEGALAAASETGTVLTSAGNGVAAAAGGFAAGGVAGGNIESAVVGAFSAGALFGVGEALGHGGEGLLSRTHAIRIVAHATIGCVSSGVQGGSCGQGAAGAGFAAFAGPVIATENFALGVAGHSIAGGIGAAVAGGKFGNGAITGAFGYLYNSAGDLRSNTKTPDVVMPSNLDKAEFGVQMRLQEIESSGGTVLGRNITVETKNGTRFQSDLVWKDRLGGLHLDEIKFGPNAKLTGPQRIGIGELRQGGFKFVGDNAVNAGLKVGLPNGGMSKGTFIDYSIRAYGRYGMSPRVERAWEGLKSGRQISGD